MLPDTPRSGKPIRPQSAPERSFRRRFAEITSVLDRRCLACGARACASLCDACFHDLPWNDHTCQRCARPLPDLPGSLCGACTHSRPTFDAAHAAFAYAWPVDRLIQRFKFNADLATGRILAQTLAKYLDLRQIPKPDILIPIPLHRARLAERGFNQSGEVARILARSVNAKVAFNHLVRTQATPAQSGLDRAARRRNLRHAFECRGSVSGLHIALVDDVITTGSTAEAAARTLKRADAARIDIYALARA